MVAVGSISSVAAKLKTDFGFVPVMSTEIEFYLPGVSAVGLPKEKTVELIKTLSAAAGLQLAQADAETGPDQFEVSLLPTRDLVKLAADTELFKQAVTYSFNRPSMSADFSAKPFAEHPGSGLHVHLHLENAQGRNVFTRAGDDMDAPFSEELLQCLGGMMALMNPCMKIFAPSEASYGRFKPKSNAPLTVSWGTNNRTVALRLPSKALDNKHIEHRVAGSDADVASVLFAVLAGAHYGLTHKSRPGEPIYGDAALAQYKLPHLAGSLQEAESYFKGGAVLATYMA